VSIVLTIAAIWLGASLLALSPLLYASLRDYLSERKQRRDLWREIDGFMGKTRLPT
jgi:hypothetical protein